ncbi:hypothetical protein [Streptomyces paradoxus]|uniref:hypothetical protein n=1 Tax=Streptomyces paradoxus TaxID=66375 RepID=UPI0037FBA418
MVHDLTSHPYVLPVHQSARFAENAWLVTQHEAACRDMSPRQVAEQAFRLADGCLMRARKDGIVHIGGFPACVTAPWLSGASCCSLQRRIPGYRLVEQPPLLRHFCSRLEPVRT